MKLIILSDMFYDKYANCQEILKKRNRPYVCLAIKINGTTYAIPMRHHISHKYCFRTGDESGLDYTKAVVITDITDVQKFNAKIDQGEFSRIKGKEQAIVKGMEDFIKIYKKAIAYPCNSNYAFIRSCSTLQYFEKYL